MDIPQNIGQLVKLLNLGSLKERTRIKFDKAFKLMVVELHKRSTSSGEIVRDPDMATHLVRRCCREYAATGEGSFAGNGIPVFTPEQREISLLNKALKEAQIERDILKRP